MARSFLFVLIALLLAPCPSVAQHGLPVPRPANTSLLIDTPPKDARNVLEVVRIFPRLTLVSPTGILELPDDSGRYFLTERAGQILSFPKDSDGRPEDVELIADFSPIATSKGLEQGLLSLALPPSFPTSRMVYVSYTARNPDGELQIARFRLGQAASEAEVLLRIPQPDPYHQSGTLKFGPDGLLYIGIGDGSFWPLGTSQDYTDLRGSVLRIDVEGPASPGLPYGIPTTNPYALGITPGGHLARRELWAKGLRNPWTMIFDPRDGALYAGDVGFTEFEEINRIEPGKNYGWPVWEALKCQIAERCDEQPFTPPLFNYSHEFGNAIIVGGVDRGTVLPELAGKLLYADWALTTLWAVNPAQPEVPPTVLSNELGIYPNAFTYDRSGRPLLLDYWGRGVFTLRPAQGETTGTAVPPQLSAIPALLAAGLGQDQSHLGIVPYWPNSELWSDGARKERFLAIPGLGTAQFRRTDSWALPDRTVLIKNFLLPLDERDPEGSLRRVETRLLLRWRRDWHGYTYRWNEDGTDAQLLPVEGARQDLTIVQQDGTERTLRWNFPARNQCRSCHTEAAGRVLGLTTPQLNNERFYPGTGATENQLWAFHYGDYLYDPISFGEDPGLNASLANPRDPSSGTVAERARAYLAANCSHCHRPGGPTTVAMDLRAETADDGMNVLSVARDLPDLGIVSGGALIAPGEPEKSVLLARMKVRDGQHQMPPLATEVVDEEAVALIQQWIEAMPKAQPTPTASPTATEAPTETPTSTPTATETAAPTATATASATASLTASPSPSSTATPMPTLTPTAAPTPATRAFPLGEAHWEPVALQEFNGPRFEAGESLSMTVTGEPSNTFGFWQSRESLPPLPEGVWRLMFHTVAHPAPPEGFLTPELRVRVFRADNLFSTMSVLVDQGPGGTRPLPLVKGIPVYWESDGETEWRLAWDLLSFAPNYRGGAQLLQVEAQWIGPRPPVR